MEQLQLQRVVFYDDGGDNNNNNSVNTTLDKPVNGILTQNKRKNDKYLSII